MELRHLRYFIKSAELLHFTDAAAALNVSQPNLSLQIQQLEEELGSQLFERAGRAVHLTPAGQLFLGYAQRALREVEAGQQEIHKLKGLVRGKLQLGVTPALTDTFSRMLAEFIQAHPTMHVSVNMGSSTEVETRIRGGELDLGLVCVSNDGEEFEFLPLSKESLVLVISPTHRLATASEIRIPDLKGIPLALPATDNRVRQLIESACAAARLEPNVVAEADNLDVLLGLARRGVAATILPGWTVTDGSSDISKIRLQGNNLKLTAQLIWLRGVELRPAAARFLALAHAGRMKRRR